MVTVLSALHVFGLWLNNAHAFQCTACGIMGIVLTDFRCKAVAKIAMNVMVGFYNIPDLVYTLVDCDGVEHFDKCCFFWAIWRKWIVYLNKGDVLVLLQVTCTLDKNLSKLSTRSINTQTNELVLIQYTCL
eukprot:scaffold3759_cov61-Cyclotella_meneghiniana.AAC.1